MLMKTTIGILTTRVLPTGGVALEKILVGVIQAIIAGLFVFPLAWLILHPENNRH